MLIPTLLWGFVLTRVWHRASYRQEALSVKLAFGWAHLFAIVDVLRRKPMGWTATGGKSKDRRVFWFRFWAAAWGAGSAAVLLGSCLWRVLADHYSPVQYAAVTVLAVVLLRTNLRVTLDRFRRAPNGRSPAARPLQAGRRGLAHARGGPGRASSGDYGADSRRSRQLAAPARARACGGAGRRLDDHPRRCGRRRSGHTVTSRRAAGVIEPALK